MTMRLLTAAVCLLPCLAGWAQPSNAAGLGPKIQFEARTYEFGKVIQGQLIRHEFVVSNAGDETLRIMDVHPSCGCTTAGAWPHELGPGKSGVIPIQINSQNLGGNIRKTVTVTSNDRASRTILEMTGEVVRPIEVEPAYAMFHLIMGSTNVAPAAVRITNHMDNPIQITSAQSDTPAFSVGQVQTLEPGRSYELSIKANPPFEHGTNAVIMVSTSWSNYMVRIPAYLTVQMAVNYQPRAIVIPAELRQTNTFVVTLYSIRQEDQFTKATCADNRVEVSLVNTSPGRPICQLRAVIPAGYTVPSGRPTFITVETTDPQMPEVRIPLEQARPYTLPPTASSMVRPRPPIPASTPIPPGAH